MSGIDGLRSRLRVVAGLSRDSNLRRLGLAYTGFKLTELASWIVILVFAYDRGGVIESGLVAALMLLPSSLIVPFASALGDRYARARALTAGYALMALSAAGCAAALGLGLSDLVVYASMLALYVGICLSQPLQMSTLVSLAGSAEDLTAANVANGLIESASYFAGPLLAALLLPSAGPWAVFALLALMMAASAFLTLGISGGDQSFDPRPPPHARQLWRDFAESLRWATRESDATLLIGLLAGHEMLIGAVDVLFVAIAFELLETGDAGAALLNAAFGLGLVGGAFVSVNLVGSRRIGGWLALGGALAGLPLIGLAGVSVEPVAMALLGLAGVGALLGEVAMRSLFQRVIPPYRIAQTFGVSESIGLIALTTGMLGAAALISLVGVATTLVTLGVGLGVVVVLIFGPIRRLEASYGPPPERALQALLRLAIFRPLGALAIEQLARSASLANAAPGDRLIRQGEAGGAFFVLLEGTVEALVDGVRVRVQGPGEHFGEISALHGIPRTATIRALTPVVALELQPELFVQAVSSHPRSLDLVKTVARARKFGQDREETRPSRA